MTDTTVQQRLSLHRADGDTPTETRKRFWAEQLEVISQRHRAGAGGLEIAVAFSDVVDNIVLDAYEICIGSQRSTYALIALGGYGRQEMSPYSDVDLLFLFKRERDKTSDLISGVLHPLWDLGFDIGHSARTLSESVKMAKEDLESCTAMLDGRLLAGDTELWQDFGRRLRKGIPKGNLAQLAALHRERGSHAGCVHLLEPNVKESPGGLREIHLLEWALKAARIDITVDDVVGADDQWALQRGRDFHWRARHELHLALGRKHDVLGHETKPTIAHKLGYQDRVVNGEEGSDADGWTPPTINRVGSADRTGADRGTELAAERFMRDYYLHANAIFHITRLAFDELVEAPRRKGRRLLLEPGVLAIDNLIEIPEGVDYFATDPMRLPRLFAMCQRRRLRLSEQSRRVIQDSLHVIDNDVRSSPETRDLLLGILKRRKRTTETLRAMHDLGVLGALLPEFGDLTCLVQYDMYHVYTVDEHTLVALERLEQVAGMDSGRVLRRVYNDLERKDLLFLGTLLHDVGKSRREEHISAGMEMGDALCQRLGLTEADRALVLFLIENHQEMVIISQRRDLDDVKLISDFADRFARVDWLRALYLLSYADLSAVAADAWSDWHGALLWELYNKTLEQLESGIKTLEERDSARQIVDRHLKAMKASWSPARVVAFEEHVSKLPARYLVAYNLEQISRHLQLVESFARSQQTQIEFVEQQHHSEIVVCTSDQRHLLANICGVLAVNDIDILTADAQTRADSVVVDTFRVADIDGSATLPEWKKERISDRLRKVIAGEVQVEELFARYSAHWNRRFHRRPRREPEVVLENQVSERYTVVDVNAQDEVGLLYTITHALGEMDLDIHMAIITTVSDRATDAFYVVGVNGDKIVNYDTLETIRSTLQDRLSESESES
ncbi:MAG: HD domain-containing protein [Candidatus Latescibacterota bacterium]|nr:HD domain-containing protein [Candidatus Latescibacterota bacterium]